MTQVTLPWLGGYRGMRYDGVTTETEEPTMATAYNQTHVRPMAKMVAADIDAMWDEYWTGADEQVTTAEEAQEADEDYAAFVAESNAQWADVEAGERMAQGLIDHLEQLAADRADH